MKKKNLYSIKNKIILKKDKCIILKLKNILKFQKIKKFYKKIQMKLKNYIKNNQNNMMKMMIFL